MVVAVVVAAAVTIDFSVVNVSKVVSIIPIPIVVLFGMVFCAVGISTVFAIVSIIVVFGVVGVSAVIVVVGIGLLVAIFGFGVFFAVFEVGAFTFLYELHLKLGLSCSTCFYVDYSRLWAYFVTAFLAPCWSFLTGEKAGLPLLPPWVRMVAKDKRMLLWFNPSVPVVLLL